MRGYCYFITFFLLSYAFLGILTIEPTALSADRMNALEQWNVYNRGPDFRMEPSSLANQDDLRGFSYADGPYPRFEDDGRLLGDDRDEPTPPWPPFEPYCVSDSCRNNFGTDFRLTTGGGDFVVGDLHEMSIGDQNGNGIMEWVVFFARLSWMEDGIDNDGDGCVDEKGNTTWEGQIGCDNIPDGMVVYETGGNPDLGGNDGSLLVNADWYSADEHFELYRAQVTPRWFAFRLRQMILHPLIAGDFITYQAQEAVTGINSNPEMDSDLDDWYLGSIGTRDFPARRITDQACSAGLRPLKDATYERNDGWVVTSYNLVESFDDQDWNGDGDLSDYVSAYYAIDPLTGDCRIGVNGAVQGLDPVNTGYIMTPAHTSESADSRDWDQSGYISGYRQLYHDIETTWPMKGRIYKSITYQSFAITSQPYGFGWWGMVKGGYSHEIHPFRFGGAYEEYVGASNGFYWTYFFLISDEDGNRHTELPVYYINVGFLSGIIGGRCVVATVYEGYLYYAGIRLIGGNKGDANGDGDWSDIVGYIFCPDEFGGGGSYIVDPNSKFAKGQYQDPFPALWLGQVVYPGSRSINGTSTVITSMHEHYVGGNVCSGPNDPPSMCFIYRPFNI